MLREIKHVRHIENEERRRWFSDDFFDLVVWIDAKDEIVGFQLCYDKARNQRAVTWHSESGFTHDRIDDGETKPGKFKATPILVADGIFEHRRIAHLFNVARGKIENTLSSFIYEKILTYRVTGTKTKEA